MSYDVYWSQRRSLNDGQSMGRWVMHVCDNINCPMLHGNYTSCKKGVF